MDGQLPGLLWDAGSEFHMNGSLDNPCLPDVNGTLWWCQCYSVRNVFLTHIWLFCCNWTWFQHHSELKFCCWPGASRDGHNLSFSSWILPLEQCAMWQDKQGSSMEYSTSGFTSVASAVPDLNQYSTFRWNGTNVHRTNALLKNLQNLWCSSQHGLITLWTISSTVLSLCTEPSCCSAGISYVYLIKYSTKCTEDIYNCTRYSNSSFSTITKLKA